MRGIRTRLAITLVVLVALTVAAIGIGVYAFVEASLRDRLLADARHQADFNLSVLLPAEVLHARKPEATVAWLERRRQQYLELAPLVPEFVVVDVDRPLDAALAEVVAAIESSWKAKNA